MFSELTDDNFDQEVIASNDLVVAYFWAEWCGPCKAFAPVFQQVAEKYHEVPELKFVKVNVESCIDAASNTGLRSVPTIVLFKDGQQIGRMSPSGPLSGEDAFVNFIKDTGKVSLGLGNAS